MAPFSFHIFNSLKGKLILSVCLSLILIVGLSTFYISQRIKTNLRDSAEDDAIFFSNVILASITDAMHSNKIEDLQEILNAITSSDYVDEIWLLDETGKVVHETGAFDQNQLKGSAHPTHDLQGTINQ